MFNEAASRMYVTLPSKPHIHAYKYTKFTKLGINIPHIHAYKYTKFTKLGIFVC